MDRTVNVIENLDGKKTVIIQDIRFRGKRNINWTDVERYLVEFIGDIYYIAENNNEEIYIGRDLPSEYTRFNVFHASLLIRHAADGRKYLYDIIEIKKETGKCCQE